MRHEYILAKHENMGAIPLAAHLQEVAAAAVVIARNGGLNESLARKGAILHDIGSVGKRWGLCI